MKSPTTTTPNASADREGFALVTTVLVVLILSVLAVAVAFIASAEKKTSFADGVHVRSVFSADAGGEAAINFIRTQDTPPQIINAADNTVRSQSNTGLLGSQSFDYDAHFMNKRPKPGWGWDYLDYNYRLAVMGEASREGQSGVELVVGRLFKEGY